MWSYDPSAGSWSHNDQFLVSARTQGTTYLSWLRANAVNVDTVVPVQPVSIHHGLWMKRPTKMISPLKGLLTNITWEVPRKIQSTNWTIRGLSGGDQIKALVIRHCFQQSTLISTSCFLATEQRWCINRTLIYCWLSIFCIWHLKNWEGWTGHCYKVHGGINKKVVCSLWSENSLSCTGDCLRFCYKFNPRLVYNSEAEELRQRPTVVRMWMGKHEKETLLWCSRDQKHRRTLYLGHGVKLSSILGTQGSILGT